MTDTPDLDGLIERVRQRAIKVRGGTNDQHTPGLLEEAATAIETLQAKLAEYIELPRLTLGQPNLVSGDGKR